MNPLVLYIFTGLVSLVVIGIVAYFALFHGKSTKSGGGGGGGGGGNTKGSWVCQYQPGPWYDCTNPLSWSIGCSPKKDNTLTRSYQCQDANGNVLDNSVCSAVSAPPITTKSDGCGWNDDSCNTGSNPQCNCGIYEKNGDYHTQQDCYANCGCGGY